MIAVNDKIEFKAHVQEKGVFLVEFGAEWCPPCKTLLPILDGMSREYDGKVTFLKLDCEEVPAIAAEFGIMSMPTVIIFHDGEPVERLVGLRTKDVYQKTIARYI